MNNPTTQPPVADSPLIDTAIEAMEKPPPESAGEQNLAQADHGGIFSTLEAPGVSNTREDLRDTKLELLSECARVKRNIERLEARRKDFNDEVARRMGMLRRDEGNMQETYWQLCDAEVKGDAGELFAEKDMKGVSPELQELLDRPLEGLR